MDWYSSVRHSNVAALTACERMNKYAIQLLHKPYFPDAQPFHSKNLRYLIFNVSQVVLIHQLLANRNEVGWKGRSGQLAK